MTEEPVFSPFGPPQTKKATAKAVAFFGGDKRDRTADLLTASQALSQLSYTPKGRICGAVSRRTVVSIAGRAGIVNTYFSFYCLYRKEYFIP